jgi:hypothetical protein
MTVSQLINEILTEWAFRVDDGMPNPKNPTHLKELGIVLSEMGLSHIKTQLIENLLLEKGKTPEKHVVEADKQFKNPILNKTVKYKNAKGEDAEGIVGNLLRLPKDHPGRKAAEALLPPEGSDERDAMNKDLGGENQPEKGEQPKDDKGGGEEQQPQEDPIKKAAQMYDPKLDPAMGVRLDKEKETLAQLAKDAEKQDKEAEKEVEPEKKEDGGFNPIPSADVQSEIPQADPETFNSPSDIPDGIEKEDLDKFNTDIQKVKQIVDDAKAKGEKAPNINLCQVTVPGTNLYCDDNLGIPRAEMPQFKGKPQPGTPAAEMPVDKDGEVDTEPLFKKMLKDKGITVTQTEVPADKLKATQSELVGPKVVGMMGALEENPNHPKITAPIYVSRDGYVIDGHHRWAAIAAYNAAHPDSQIPMKVQVIDQDIKDAIPMCNKFAEEQGVAAKKADANKEDVAEPKGTEKLPEPKEPSTKDGGVIYSIGGGYYSDTPGGPAQYVATESVVEKVLIEGDESWAYMLFEAVVNKVTAKGKKVKVKTIDTKKQKAATKVAKAAKDKKKTSNKKQEQPIENVPQHVSDSLNKGSLDGLKQVNSELIKQRDQGIAGAGGPVASYGEAALTTFANTLNDIGGFKGYVKKNSKEVSQKIKLINSKKSAFQNAINGVAKQLGFVLPKDEAQVIQYLAARMVFAEQELERLKADKNSLWYKTGKNGFGQDEKAFLEWAKADFDGALSTRRLIREHSKIDTTKPHIVIQSNPKKGGHDEGIVNHLQAKLEQAKKSGNKDDIKHYQNELYCFAKLGFHDTMVVGYDTKGRTTVFSITNKKQDDLQDIWGNTTPEYALNLIKSKFGPDVSNRVIKTIDDGIVKVTNSKKATTRLFAEMEIDDNFVAICDTPEMKKYMGQLKDHKKFNSWLAENGLKPKTTAEWLQYAQEYATIDDSAPYEPFGKFVHKVGELSQNGPFKRKHSEIDFESNSIQTSIENKNEEKEVVAAVHKQVADEIAKADKKLGFPKNGLNGPHTQAYLTTVMHSMHFDLMVENFDGNLGAITGIRGSVPSDFRECLAKLSNFKGDIKSKAGRDELNKHLLERCKVNPQTRAIEITNEAGTTVLAEDTWRTAGTSQKVEKKLGGGLRECVSSKVDGRQKKNRQVV